MGFLSNMWKRQSNTTHVQHTDFILIILIVFSLVGLFTKNSIVLIVVGSFLTYLILNKYYDKNLDSRLELKNPRSAIKLFPNEEAKITMKLKNNSYIPFINGKLSFEIDPVVDVLHHNAHSRQNINMLLSVIGNRLVTIQLPIRANKRGVSKIRNIAYTFPHLLKFDTVTLLYSYFYHTEIIVFPKLEVVTGIDAVFQMIPGEERMNFSPYEDVQNIIGTRDYRYGDSFHRINWKATAKTQQLQTNMYEMVVDMTYVFIVNIGSVDKDSGGYATEHIEQLLSNLAYVSEYATKNEYPYKTYINTRQPGKIPYLSIPEGSSHNHYLYTLEALARVQSQSLVVPFNEMLYQIGLNLYKPKTIILFGHIPEASYTLLDKWIIQGHTIFNVDNKDDVATVVPWIKGELYDAK